MPLLPRLRTAPAAWSLLATLALPLTHAAPPLSDTVHGVPRWWQPVPDHVYWQEIGEKLPTPQPVTAVAVHQGTLHAVTGNAIHILRNGALHRMDGGPAGVTRLRSLEGFLWALTPAGAHRLEGATWRLVGPEPVIDVTVHRGVVHGATRDAIFRLDGDRWVNIQPAEGWLSNDSTMLQEDFTQVLADPVTLGPILRLASHAGTLYLLRPQGLALIEGRTLIPNPVDWGALPSPRVRDLVAAGSRLLVATDRGVGLLRGMSLTAWRGEDGLPCEDVTCLAAGWDGDMWVGTTRGAIRRVGREFHYFGADLWLPGERVHDLAVGDRVVYVGTEGGVGVLRYEPFTLAKKAAYFEREMEDWGFKRLGFVHQLYRGDDDAWWREISDNDGGNSAGYLAAMAFKHAATRDEAARREAQETFQAMIWLDDITPKPGFIARSIWSVPGDPGTRSTRGSGGLPAKWYATPDGQWFWKGDTSSDEVNGHFYGVSLFHDLVASGPERERAARHLANISTHLLENGWVLRDMDGKPTRWGRWDPDYLLRPYGFEARGLNGMEAQTYMITAFALTGDPRFQAGLEQTVRWRYHTYTVRQKLTFPPDAVVPWDDELAFRCYVPLLRYTTDPELRALYLRSLERSWEVQRRQQVPYYNFIFGALTGYDCDVDAAVQHLREWSLDPVNYSYRNSHRADLDVRPRTPFPDGVPTRAISPRESGPKWGSRPALELDGGQDGRVVTPPIGWLEDYWMGRYFGFIAAPDPKDAAASRLSPRTRPVQGAAPYAGPARPGN